MSGAAASASASASASGGGVVIGVAILPGRDPALPLPAYATPGAAGADICVNLPEAERAAGRVLAPGARTLAPTGLAFAIPPGWEAQLRPRSGLALRDGLTLLNSPGTIDADYRGEVGVIVVNHGAGPVTIAHGMRIAQVVVAPAPQVAWRLVDALDATARGEGGFGSTGTAAAAATARAGG